MRAEQVLEVRFPLLTSPGSAALDEETGELWIHLRANPIDGRLVVRIPQIVALRKEVDALEEELIAKGRQLDALVKERDALLAGCG